MLTNNHIIEILSSQDFQRLAHLLLKYIFQLYPCCWNIDVDFTKTMKENNRIAINQKMQVANEGPLKLIDRESFLYSFSTKYDFL